LSPNFDVFREVLAIHSKELIQVNLVVEFPGTFISARVFGMRKEMCDENVRVLREFELPQTPLAPPMKAVIIYDNFAFAARAAERLQRAAQQVDTAIHWNLRLWRLDTLSLPQRADEALAEAVDAHLIVFAGHRTQLLPSGLLDCLERWAACRQVADAAFAVIGGRNGDELVMPKAPDLSHFASQHGLSFIFDEDFATQCEGEFTARDATGHGFSGGLRAHHRQFRREKIRNYAKQK